MNDYEKYVTEVNNIFSLLEKLKNTEGVLKVRKIC